MKIHPISDIFKFTYIRYPIFPSLKFVTDMISDIWKKTRYLPISDVSENRYAISGNNCMGGFPSHYYSLTLNLYQDLYPTCTQLLSEGLLILADDISLDPIGALVPAYPSWN